MAEVNGKTKEQICNDLGVSTKTFERFIAAENIEGTASGSIHERHYSENIVERFKKWLIKNQQNQGKKTGAKSLIIKQTAH